MEEAAGDNKGVNYPPTAVLAFEQLTWLSPKTAFWLFQGIELGSLLVVIWLLVWTEADNPLGVWAKLSLSGLMVFYYPVSEQFHSGAISIIVLALLLLMRRESERRQDLKAGLALAIATLVKVFPAITVLYLALWKKWRLMWSFLAIALLLSLLTIGLVGFGNCFAYLARARILNDTQNGPLSLKAFVLHVFKLSFGWPLGNLAKIASLIVTVVVEVAVVLVAVRGTLRALDQQSGEEHSFALWLVTMVVLTPTAWAHYGVFFLPALAQLARQYLAGRAPPRAFYCGVVTYLFSDLVGLLFVLAANGSTLPIIRNTGYRFESMSWVYGLFFPAGVLAFATAYFLCVD